MIRIILICLALTCAAARATAAPLTAAGDGTNLWLVAPVSQTGSEDAPVIALLHRTEGDENDTVQLAATLRGSITPGAAVASASRLYLVYDDGTIQWLAHTPPVLRYDLRYGDATVAGRLPEGTSLSALGADRRGPWALVQVETPAALAAIDAPPTSDEKAGDDEAIAIESAAPSSPPALPVDRLLRLSGHHWQRVALPADWSHGSRAWIVALDSAGEKPYLISLSQPDTLTVFDPRDGEQWRATDYTIADATADRLHVLAVGEQLLVARAIGEGAAVAVSLLREGSVIDLGDLRMDAVVGSAWTLAAMGQSLAMIVDRTSAGAVDVAPGMTFDFTCKTLSLQGNVTDEAPLAVQRATPIEQSPGRLLVVAALSCAMLLMFTMWRREPLLTKLNLPKNTAVADLPRRTIAAAIDLAPGIAVAMVMYAAPRDDWSVLWPGNAMEWSEMWPGIITLAITALHTTLSEMFFARTLGKFATGLRVITTQGELPNIWQAITRNILRTFDLVAWYVLPILMILSPYRQRLGDMLARTIVIMDLPEDRDEE